MAIIRIIGVPMDLGASRRGVDMGPFAVRYTDLRARIERIGHAVEDAGNIDVPFREDAERGAQRGARFLGAITDVCMRVADETAAAIGAGRFPLLLGGDHSLAGGSIAGARKALRGEGRAHRRDLARRTRRPQHAGLLTIRKCARHAARTSAWPWRPGLRERGRRRPAVRAEQLALVGVRDLDTAEREHAARVAVAGADDARDR